MRATLRRVRQLSRNPGMAWTLAILGIVSMLVLRLTQEVAAEVVVGELWEWVTAAPPWLQVPIGAVSASAIGYAIWRRHRKPKPDILSASDTLPPSPTNLVGRDVDVATAVSHFDVQPQDEVRPRIVAIVGRRAIGTSAVAAHVAQEVADRFPDGTVYLDLRGLASHEAHTPESALQALMHRLDLKYDPHDAVDQLQKWYADKRKLVFLNNVDQPAQVEQLLPRSGGSGVVLAGSLDLESLPNVYSLRLEEISEDAAVELLVDISGRSAIRRDPVARELVNACGRQPLAVRLLGHVMRKRPRWQPSEFVAEMRRSAKTPRPFPLIGQVWGAPNIVYRTLSREQQRVFRLLVLVPTIEIGNHAAAAVAGVSPDRAARILDELADDGLIESVRSGYYRVRQLLAASARFHLLNEDSHRRRTRACVRLARYYTLLAERYAEPLLFAREPITDATAASAQREGHQWFQREHETLHRLITSLVADDEMHPVRPWLWRLAMGLCTWYAVENRFGPWREVCEAILDAQQPEAAWSGFRGTRRWSPEVAYWAHNELGVLHRRLGDLDRAYAELEQARKIAIDWRLRSRAQVETNIGLVLLDKGDVNLAAGHLTEGLRLRARSDVRGRAVSELALGIASLHAKLHVAARRHLHQAVNEFERLGDHAGQGAALNALGLLHATPGNLVDKHHFWRSARNSYVAAEDQLGEASVLYNVGLDLLRDGKPAPAQEALRESLQLRTGYPATIHTALTHHLLGEALRRTGDETAAAEHFQAADRIMARIGA